MTAHLLLTYAALVTLGLVVGMAIGEWSARRDRRETIERRQILSQLLAVASARGVRL